MGLLDLFSNKPTPSKILKLKKRMLNEHHQQPVRQESMEELVRFGTPEAIAALIERLAVNFRDSINNEQEKRWIANMLVEHFPERAVEPLKVHVRTGQIISYSIRTLERLIGPARTVDFLLEVLAGQAPEDHRTQLSKLQLIEALEDHEDDRIAGAVLPYLADHDDDIRVKVLETLESRYTEKKDQVPAEVTDAIADLLKNPEASGRVLRRAGEALIGLDADIGKRATELAEFVPEGYIIDQRGRLAKR